MFRISRPAAKAAFSICAVAAASACITSNAVAQQAQYNTIALTGFVGTGLGFGPNLGPGVHFFTTGRASIGADGQIAFAGGVGGTGITINNDSGIWSNAGGGSVALVVREGDRPFPVTAPDVAFSAFQATTPPSFNTDGGMAFKPLMNGTLSGGPWRYASGAFTPLVGDGTVGPGPNLGPDVAFTSFGGGTGGLSPSGRTAFFASLTGPGIDSTNSSGIWTAGPADAPAIVARTGNTGPGPNVGAGVTFASFPYPPAVTPSGKTAFYASVAGTGVDSTNNTGIWTNVGGALSVVARGSTVRQPVINEAGTVAFSTTDNIQTYANGTLTVAAGKGIAGPGPNLGPNVFFEGLGDPVINSAGSLAFRASASGPDFVNRYGIWSTAGGTMHAVAMAGVTDTLPGVAPGITFASELSGFSHPVMNARGDVAFIANLTGPGVTSTNDTALWASVNGELYKIAREGDMFDIDPGPGTTLQGITQINWAASTAASGGEDGRTVVFNDAGMLVFDLSFTGSAVNSGTFTALVPEPSCGATLAIGAILVARRRRQR